MLPWKGGVERSTKQTLRFGCLNYLAMWQGLRGEDLEVDLHEERVLTCPRTQMVVRFTHDQSKFVEP